MTRDTLNTTIPGLSIDWTKIGGKLYATVIHSGSGLKVVRFTDAPLPFGKKEFIKRLDESAFRDINWTKSAEELGTSEILQLTISVKRKVLNHVS